MRIFRDIVAGTLALIPADRGEKRTMINVLGAITSGRRLWYCGRRDTDHDPAQALMFRAGGYSEQFIEASPFCTYRGYRYKGGVLLVLRGTNLRDKKLLLGVRSAVYMNGGTLHLLQQLRGGGAVFTAKRCKHCRTPMIDRISCEWNTCNLCALVCVHEYERGAVTGGGVDIGIGEFCGKCGRGKPLPRLTQDEHHMAVGAEFGIQVIETDTRRAFAQEVARRVVRDAEQNS